MRDHCDDVLMIIINHPLKSCCNGDKGKSVYLVDDDDENDDHDDADDNDDHLHSSVQVGLCPVRR